MADGSDQYIEARYSNDKLIWEGPKTKKKKGAQIGKSRILGPKSEIRHSKWGPKRQKKKKERGLDRKIENRGAQTGKTPYF